MAAEIEELLIKISADNTAFQAKMEQALGTVEKTTKEMQKDFQDFSKESVKNTSVVSQAMATMGGILGSQLVLGAVNKLREGFAFLGAQFMEGLEASKAQEEATTRLSVSLANAGNFTVEARDKFVEYANAIEATTGVSDDAVISAGSLLASIGKLSGEGLERATTAAVNLSAALGIDLDAASQLVAKAANGNVSALQRYGIQIQEGTTDSETFANALSKLEGQFGGFAEKLQGTFSGSIRNAQNQFGNLFETLADSVRTNQVVVATFNAVAKVFGELEALAKANADELRIFVGEGIIYTIEAMRAFIVVLDTVRAVWVALTATVNTIIDGWVTAIQRFVATVQSAGTTLGQIMDGDFKGAFNTVKENLQDTASEAGFFADRTVNEFSKVTDSSETLLQVDAALARVGQSAEIAFEQTKEGAQALQEPLNNGAGAAVEMSDALTDLMEKSKEFAEIQARAAEEQTSMDTAKVLEETDAQLALLEKYYAQRTEKDQAYYDTLNFIAEESTKKQNEIAQKQLEAEEKKQKERASNLNSTLSTISSLAGSKSKELAAIGKAAAIAQATMDTYAGANKALASAPPPFNFALAAAVVAAGVANVAKIAGTPLQSGIDSVPGIGNQDNFPAVLAPGERVVPRETNKDLKQFLAEGGANQAPQISVTIAVQGDFFESEDANQRLLERIQRGILQTGFKLQT